MSTVAIIPARGGSKRIPDKNIKNFAGQPIIAYSIQRALKSELFDRVIVSTDSEKIAKVAISYGAEAPFHRPAEISDDFTGTAPVLIHALKWLERNGFNVKYCCCIYPTAPFLEIKYLQEGLKLIKKNRATTAFSVTSFPYPINRALKINSQGRIEMMWPEYEHSRSNDLAEAYHDAGQFYWIDAKIFQNEKKLFSSNSIPIVLPRYQVVDIDTFEDWHTAELLHKVMQQY